MSKSIFFDLPTSPKLHVRETGHGPNNCVLIHGFGEGAYVWEELASVLTPRYRTLALDLRGHGESAWDPSRKYSLAVHAQDATDFIKEFQLDKFVVIGHSMGADIALRMCDLYPRRIQRLILVDYSPDITANIANYILDDFNSENRIYPELSDYAALLEEKRPLAGAEVLRRLAEHALRPHPLGGFELKRDPALGWPENFEIETDIATWDRLKKLSCPTLVVRGMGSSVLSSATAIKMKNTVRQSQVANIAMAGHAVMIDNPEDFSAAVDGFLSQISEGCTV